MVEFFNKKTLKDAFDNSLQPANKVYPKEEPVVDVDLSACSKKDQPRMISMINRLSQSQLGKETLEIAAKNGFKFEFISGENRAFGYADPEDKKIALNPRFCDEKLIGTLCHEARHAGQFSRAENLDECDWDVKTNLIYMRAMEADAQAYASSACEELSRAGDKGPLEQFFKYYPEIAAGFSNALDQNQGKLGHQLLTDTFKAWYDQEGTKSVYEEGYLLEPMQEELKQIAKEGDVEMTFSSSISAEKTIAEIAWTKEGNYFKDDPNILNSGKYLDVSEFSMEQMQKFFKYRADLTGKDDSKCLDGIPVRANTITPRVKKMTKPKASKKMKAQKEKILANKKNVQKQSEAVSKMMQIHKKMDYLR